MKLLRSLRPADWITVADLALVLLAFGLVLRGRGGPAVGVLALSIVGDHLDGVVARRWGGSPYGASLDGAFDVLAYLVFPALFVGMATGFDPLYAVPVGAAVIAGVLRLARFSVRGFADPDAAAYVGMPVFYLGFVPPALLLGVPAPVVAAALLVAAVLMVSELRFAKPRGVVVPSLVLVVGIGFLIWGSNASI